MSDPDLSGTSDKDTAKKGQQQKADKQDEPAKPADESQSEGKFVCDAKTAGRFSWSVSPLRLAFACDWLRTSSYTVIG